MSSGSSDGLFQPRQRADWRFLVAAFALQLLATVISPLLSVGVSRLTAIWVCTGVTTAILLLAHRRDWPWIAGFGVLAPLLLRLVGFGAWWDGSGLALFRQQLAPLGALWQLLESISLALCIQHFVPDLKLGRLGDALRYLGVALVISLSAAFGRGLFLLSYADGMPVLAAVQRWFLADLLGQLICIPLVIGFWPGPLSVWNLGQRRRWLLEGALIGLAIAAYTLLVLNYARPDDHFILRFPHWLFAFFLWSALRVPLPIVALHFAIAMLTALPAVIFSQGPFGAIAPTDEMAVFRFQAFFLMCLLGTIVAKSVLTEANEANERLRRNLDRLELILKESSIGWWEWNFHTNETRYSPSWKAQLGYFDNEVASEVAAWESRLHPADRQPALDYNAEYVRDPQPLYELDFRLRHRDGSYRWIMSRAKLYDDETGKPAWLRGIHLDITDRVQNQQHLRERDAQLAHVSRLTTMGELVAGISHELNQPLFAIGNFAQAAETMLSGAMPADQQQLMHWVSMIAQANEQAGAIIQRVQNYVRRGAVERQPTDVNAVVRAAFELIAFQARQNQVTFHWKLAPTLPKLPGDPVQLEQVFVNLLKNACEAAAEATERAVVVTSRAEGDAIVVTVDDSGPGVPEEEREEIFAAFHSSKAEGLGLGLAISRSLIDAHGGKLTVESSSSGGARFLVRLPYRGAAFDAGEDAPGVVSPEGVG